MQRSPKTSAPTRLALHTQAVLQGAFVVAKATGRPRDADECIDHLFRHLELLFDRTTR